MFFTNYKKIASELNFLASKLRPLHGIVDRNAAIDYIEWCVVQYNLQSSDHGKYVKICKTASVIEDIEITVDLDWGIWEGSGNFYEEDGSTKWTKKFEVDIVAVGYDDFTDFFMRVHRYQDVISTKGRVRGRKTMPLIDKYCDLFKGSSTYTLGF